MINENEEIENELEFELVTPEEETEIVIPKTLAKKDDDFSQKHQNKCKNKCFKKV